MFDAFLSRVLRRSSFPTVTCVAMVSAARRAASRAGYAWRLKQPGLSSAVELLLAPGHFLEVESGWRTTELIALLAGGSVGTSGSTQRSCCTGGFEWSSQIDAQAIIELEGVQALLECRLESMECWVSQLWNVPFDEQFSRPFGKHLILCQTFSVRAQCVHGCVWWNSG